jgi:hypothetical protein
MTYKVKPETLPARKEEEAPSAFEAEFSTGGSNYFIIYSTLTEIWEGAVPNVPQSGAYI